MLFGIKNISLISDFPLWAFIIGIVLITIFATYSYNKTIPLLPFSKRISLLLLRIAGFTLILALFFNIKLSYDKKETKNLKPYIFIDISSSVMKSDSSKIKQILEGMNEPINIFGFGDSVRSIDLNHINFKDKSTNFNNVFNFMQRKDDIKSAFIISDGILNSGENPLLQKNYELAIPVNTVLIGDTNSYKDISVTNILFETTPYFNKPNKIKVDIEKSFEEEATVKVDFWENNKLITSKTLILKENYSSIFFNYKPSSKGMTNLKIKINSGLKEKNISNNTFSKFYNIKESKIKIALIGTPSYDYSFLKRALEKNEDYVVNSFYDINGNNSFSNLKDINNSDLLIISGFPGKKLNKVLYNRISSEIKNGKKFIYLFSSGIDLNKKDIIENIVGIEKNKIGNTFNPLTDIEFNQEQTMFGNLLPIEFSLPFVFTPLKNNLLKRKILISGKTGENNLPLLVETDNNLIFTVSGLWKWKLKLHNDAPQFFERLIYDCVSFIRNRNNKLPITIRTNKLIYQSNENIRFEANVLDKFNRPYDSASVKITFNNKSFTLDRINNSYFANKLMNIMPGNYNYKAEVFKGKKNIYNYTGKFSVSEFELEEINTKADKKFMLKLSRKFNGKFYDLKNFANLNFSDSNKIIYSKNSLNLWPNKEIIIFIILLFSIEWFLRKKWGLL